MLGRWVLVLVLAGAAACGGSSPSSSATPPPEDPPPVQPPPVQPPPTKPPVKAPVTVGDYLFWSVEQGLSPSVHDVSADEGGNVYVAADDAVYAKQRADADFLRFAPEDAGLTANCWPSSEIANPSPAGPPATCPIVSVAGAGAGKAVIGFRGVGTDYDYDGPWALDSGGADLVAFDGQALTRARHVRVASPPGVICEHWGDPPRNTECDETWLDSTWMGGRKKMRQINRIVVNHDPRRAISQGDVLFGGTHGSIAILAAHPDARGMIDYTKGDPAWADTQWVWEHEHPAITSLEGAFLTGEAWAIAIDPLSGVPWFANQFRTARLPGYVSMPRPSWNGWWGDMDPPSPFIAWWRDDPAPPIHDANARDNVTSLAFCEDGTLWIGSATLGLARRGTDGSVRYVGLPGGGNSVLAVACDPSDGSLWVGRGWGGFSRLRPDGTWETAPLDAPAFVNRAPVRSIQIDRWSTPRIVYLAHEGTSSGEPGGVTAYRGP